MGKLDNPDNAIERESLAETVRIVEEERMNEEIETLYRYVDIKELISYFGEGKSFEDRVRSGLNNPDLWFVLNGHDVTEKEVQELKAILGEVSEVAQISDLGKVDTDSLLSRFGLKRGKGASMFIPPTIRGFSVNASASNYRSKYKICLLPVGRKKKVKDIKGDVKIVPFEPTYVSTPRIKIEEYRHNRINGEFTLNLWGRVGEVVDKERRAFLLDEINRIRVSLGADVLREIPDEFQELEEFRNKIITIVDDSRRVLAKNIPAFLVATDGNARVILCTDQTPEEIADRIISSGTDIVLLDYILKRSVNSHDVSVNGIDVMNALKSKGYDGEVIGYSSDDESQEKFMDNGAMCCADKNNIDQGEEVIKIAEVYVRKLERKSKNI